MILAGVDYSMQSPGIAIASTDDDLIFENVEFHGFNGTKSLPGVYGNITIHPTDKEWPTDEERYSRLARRVVTLLNNAGVEWVCLEGLSMGSRKGSILNIAQNHGEFRQALTRQGIPFILPAPTEIKKAFSGKGNAKKEAMVDAFDQKTGNDIGSILGKTKYNSPENDLVDAFAMLEFIYKQVKGQ